MEKIRLTPQERAWVLYDVGNSAFVMMVSTLIPIYFNALAGAAGISSADYLAYWGYAASVVTLIVAFLGPSFGTVADTEGYKKPIFLVSVAVGCVGCVAIGFTPGWISFLVVFVVAKVGYASSLVFYDGMINDITTEERVDDVSARGYAWGYIGSCIPFAACLVLVLCGGSFGLAQITALKISFVITAVWWACMTLPLLRRYRQIYSVGKQKHVIRSSFERIAATLKNVRREKPVFLFLLAFFCYIDGVYTIIDMATAYGTALGLDTTGLLLALLVTQIVAFPAALLYGRLSAKYPSAKLLPVCIAAYFCIAVYAYFLDSQLKFWILAVVVGMFQGGIQSLSRSHFAKLIPPEKSGEYFGLFDICGKGASFLGTMIVSVTTQVTGSANLGVGALAILFAAGFLLFRVSVKAAERETVQ